MVDLRQGILYSSRVLQFNSWGVNIDEDPMLVIYRWSPCAYSFATTDRLLRHLQ